MRQLPAFQLGSIVADARVASGDGREVTHFYAYGSYITEHPWRAMLRLHPALRQAQDEAHLAFLAGYVAHLATDEAWALKMVRPQFWDKQWIGVERREKFLAFAFDPDRDGRARRSASEILAGRIIAGL